MELTHKALLAIAAVIFLLCLPWVVVFSTHNPWWLLLYSPFIAWIIIERFYDVRRNKAEL